MRRGGETQLLHRQFGGARTSSAETDVLHGKPGNSARIRFDSGSNVNRPVVAVSPYPPREFPAHALYQGQPVVRPHSKHDDGLARVQFRYLT